MIIKKNHHWVLNLKIVQKCQLLKINNTKNKTKHKDTLEKLKTTEKIIEKFPGDQPFSFKWANENPFESEEILHIATCDDGFVDADNTELYEYIYDLMHPFV